MDEGEEGGSTSPWKSPCPCSLRAHEECLLEWIADKEATNAKDGLAGIVKIECPQCKATLKIQRPKEMIVLLTDLISTLARMVQEHISIYLLLVEYIIDAAWADNCSLWVKY
jgi:hypothetical protein